MRNTRNVGHWSARVHVVSRGEGSKRRGQPATGAAKRLGSGGRVRAPVRGIRSDIPATADVRHSWRLYGHNRSAFAALRQGWTRVQFLSPIFDRCIRLWHRYRTILVSVAVRPRLGRQIHTAFVLCLGEMRALCSVCGVGARHCGASALAGATPPIPGPAYARRRRRLPLVPLTPGGAAGAAGIAGIAGTAGAAVAAASPCSSPFTIRAPYLFPA